MTALFDTHIHMDSTKYNEDRHEMIARAKEAGVELFLNIGFNRETIATTLALADQYSEVYAAIGWHPVDTIDMKDDDLNWIEEQSKHPKVVAIGEIGLDYHWDTSPKDLQQQRFREQIRLAKKIGKPIVIHNRDAHADVVQILREENAAEVGGVMHCFSGSWEIAKECLAMNFYISFGGPVTFLNAKMPKEVLANTPIDKILIETDAPYLTPHPFRGKRNEAAYVALVAESVAQIKGLSVEEIGEITMRNGKKLFGIV
ncbi:TatD family hydrolase [Paenibacillus yanchengensis]|uniref:TatD family hydrolase n=1 Tax=Paenibacillus yanchengensis TaxID=2035833 RepID=A0ABW4YIH0_9BACL